MDKTEKRICWYSSVLIALLMSSPKLLALRQNSYVGLFWQFNLGEFLFQVGSNVLFCFLLFWFNLRGSSWLKLKPTVLKQIAWVLVNVLLSYILCLVFGVSQRRIFDNEQLRGVYWWGYLSRFLLSGIFAAIIIKIIRLIRESKQKEKENAGLKAAYLEAELEVLKEQLNPHFLFNTLSSLSGIVREDPEKAQYYINHLSKIFRYSLEQASNNLVTIEDELNMIRSYEQLLKMRLEDAFHLEIAIDDSLLQRKIPHLSLQPLLENAAKHNTASLKKPLKVKIYTEGNSLVVTNNLQQINNPDNSTGLGLANLNSRFRILMQNDIGIEKTETAFTVTLSLA